MIPYVTNQQNSKIENEKLTKDGPKPKEFAGSCKNNSVRFKLLVTNNNYHICKLTR